MKKNKSLGKRIPKLNYDQQRYINKRQNGIKVIVSTELDRLGIGIEDASVSFNLENKTMIIKTGEGNPIAGARILTLPLCPDKK
jgi:hypothetical protein